MPSQNARAALVDGRKRSQARAPAKTEVIAFAAPASSPPRSMSKREGERTKTMTRAETNPKNPEMKLSSFSDRFEADLSRKILERRRKR